MLQMLHILLPPFLFFPLHFSFFLHFKLLHLYFIGIKVSPCGFSIIAGTGSTIVVIIVDIPARIYILLVHFFLVDVLRLILIVVIWVESRGAVIIVALVIA